MSILINALLFIAISYNLFQFIVFWKKRKEPFLLPVLDEDWLTLRKYPQLKEGERKENVIPYLLILSAVIILYILGFVFSDQDDWAFNLMLIFLLLNANNLLNGFAVIEDGLLSEGRFIPWRKIKAFYFVPIDIHHRSYGYDKDVNDGYELQIKGKFLTIRCFVTTDEMKEKMEAILSKHITMNSEKKA